MSSDLNTQRRRPERKTVVGSGDGFNAFVERFEPVASSTSDSPLARTPIAFKDMLDFAGRSAGWGVQRRGPPASRDAAVISALRDAGARFAGATVMTPLAFEPSGENHLDGRPVNPLDPSRICGGSSSGSAVAVASGQVRIALGSDTGGSLRIPAHCCGVTALKPTNGAVATDGAMPLAPSLDTIGFLADAAATIEPFARVAIGARAASAPIGKIGVASDLAVAATPFNATAMAQAALTLQAMGLDLAEIDLQPVLQACDEPVLTLLRGEAARSHCDWLASSTLDGSMKKRLAQGLRTSDGELTAARRRLGVLRTEILAAELVQCDAILLPVMPVETPLVAQCDPASPDFSPRTLYALSAYARFANGLGLPVIAFPAGVDTHGMPVGVQLVGRPDSEFALLDAVRQFQQPDNTVSA